MSSDQKLASYWLEIRKLLNLPLIVPAHYPNIHLLQECEVSTGSDCAQFSQKMQYSRR